MVSDRGTPSGHSPATPPTPLWPASWRRSFVEALICGVVIACIDINQSDGQPDAFSLTLFAGVLLGLRNAGRALACWLPLGLSVYLVHVVAISAGRKPPFVEADLFRSSWTLVFYSVAGAGLMLGVLARGIVNAFGRFVRHNAPPVRIVPATTAGWMLLIALLAAQFAISRFVHGPHTVYSPGYNEAAFLRLRIGMTPGEVRSLLGAPLWEGPGSHPNTEHWSYSEGRTETDDYWRRQVVFKDGKVELIDSSYWED